MRLSRHFTEQWDDAGVVLEDAAQAESPRPAALVSCPACGTAYDPTHAVMRLVGFDIKTYCSDYCAAVGKDRGQ